MRKKTFLVFTLTLIVNLLCAQTQKESLNASALKGKSWIGIEMGLNNESIEIPYFHGNFVMPINPSANYHYFVLDRWSVFGALGSGKILPKNLNKINVDYEKFSII